MTLYNSVTDLIGNTPLVRLSRLEKARNLGAHIYAKLEMFNPAGSVKDRAALFMIRDALDRGLIREGSTIIEPTSGNTGIGLALAARVYGLRLILTMPESMSLERRALLKARGAELVLTPASEGMKGAVSKAEEIRNSIPGSIIVGQFENPANPRAHELTTAVELWEDLKGEIAAVVAGIGTGGTISGIARGLKSRNPAIKAVGVEPLESPLITGGQAGPHKIQGIGANFIPKCLYRDLVDEVLPVAGDLAIRETQELNRIEAIMAGISGGASLAGALELARRPEYAGKNIVAIIPDTGEHYLSTEIFS
ncbi:cysteine synthase A [Succinimonas amylolytica]|uniref:cysteine synthase A n=1 Tax=Succinimonas amylolytica TaxID=83769 RepID=UPI00036BFD7F|nr:cysteine synthase A [Succinimonas amylolytica]